MLYQSFSPRLPAAKLAAATAEGRSTHCCCGTAAAPAVGQVPITTGAPFMVPSVLPRVDGSPFWAGAGLVDACRQAVDAEPPRRMVPSFMIVQTCGAVPLQ